MVNRSAAVIRPRDPFVKWATSLDADAKQFEADIRAHVSVYLVPQDPKEQQESAPVDEWFSEVFERELEGWYRDESRWPPVRDVATFRQWFEVSTTSVVVDLDKEPLELERL